MYGQKENPALVRTVVLEGQQQNVLVLLLTAGMTTASIPGRMFGTAFLFIFRASNLNTVNIFKCINANPDRKQNPFGFELSLVLKQLLAHKSLVSQLPCLQVKSSVFKSQLLEREPSGPSAALSTLDRFHIQESLYFAPTSFPSTLMGLPVLAAKC